jgi:peptidyl-prolyl cis-trans isomerase B (cyclophilin B)
VVSNKRAREVERERYERQQQRRAQQRAKTHQRNRVAGTVAVVLAFVAVGGAVVLISLNSGGSDNASPSGSGSTSVSPSTVASGSANPEATSLTGVTKATCTTPVAGSPGTKQYSSAPSASFPTGAAVAATLKTTCGNIPMALDAAKAPATVASFVSLAAAGYFDHTKCHRLTTAGIYVLQCGDPTGSGSGGPGYTLPDENLPSPSGSASGAATVLYPAGTVAMANTGSPHTGGSQFFLVYQDTQLGPSYTVFGQMTAAGLATVRSIAKGGVQGGAQDGPPALNVVINSVGVVGVGAGAVGSP